MRSRATRRRFIAGTTAIGIVGTAGCLGDDGGDDGDGGDDADGGDDTDGSDADADGGDDGSDPEAGYEIWAADQGTDTVYIYEPDGDEFSLVDEIDTAAEGGNIPHMVHFSSDYEYVAIACTEGARTLVYRTEDRELVGNIETGAASHFAGFSPDDDKIVVDVIGESEIVRVDADLENEEFEIEDRIAIDENIDGLTEQEGAPICHSYDHSGRSIHTLGPGYGNAGLVIVDHDEFEVAQAWNGDEIPTNCGTIPHPTEDKFYLTAGLPSNPEEDVEGVGDFYVLDTENDELLVDGESTGGIDAHGFWFTPDGEELWVLNRETNDGLVLDPESDEVVEEIDAFGPDQSENFEERDAPDIMWATPDGEYMIVTLRGPNPQSGAVHAATGVNPGFAILDIESREIVDNVVPAPDDDASDFHGIGVRPLEETDGLTSPPF